MVWRILLVMLSTHICIIKSTKKKTMKVNSIIIRHISGTKSNQIEEFSFDDNDVITIGRSEDSMVQFDSDKEIGVSRNHATLRKGNQEGQFFVEDNNSMNGLLVNEEKISGSKEIFPGDKIQLGLKGPKFEFDLDPRPESSQATELISIAADTEEMSLQETSIVQPSKQKVGIGQETFERAIIVERKKSTINMLAIFGGFILLFSALGYTFKDKLFRSKQLEVIKQEKVIIQKEGLDGVEISKSNSKKIVKIESGWKLVHAMNGDDIFHEYLTYKDEKTGEQYRLPAFIEVEKGVLEPSLNFRKNTQDGEAIASIGGGTGFVVGKDGLIMTTKNVATPWVTPYYFPSRQGILLAVENGKWVMKQIIECPRNWIPANTRLFGREPISGRGVTGETTYLDVVFAKTERRHRGSIATESSEHNLAIVKINMVGNIEPVKFASRDTEVQEGENVLCMGFPSLSPDAVKYTKDQSTQSTRAKIVPSATISDGIISKIIRSSADASLSETKNDIFSFLGDYYQSTLGTSAGNGGGPVFNEKGEVIAIFNTSNTDYQGTVFNYLVPAKYALNLMSTETVIK